MELTDKTEGGKKKGEGMGRSMGAEWSVIAALNCIQPSICPH